MFIFLNILDIISYTQNELNKDSFNLMKHANIYEYILIELLIPELPSNIIYKVNNIKNKVQDLGFCGLFNYQLHIILESDKLDNLQYLLLRNNTISTIPILINKLGNLRVLYLEYNKIKFIPDSIKKLYNLQILYLHNNQIENIPDSISLLQNLYHIDMDNNLIKNILNQFKKIR